MTGMSDTTGSAPTSMVAPQLDSQIEEAPGQGIVPGISLHMAAKAQLFHLDAQPVEQLGPLSRRYLEGTNSTFVKWTAKKGGVVPLHHHSYEQITWILEGAAEVHSQGLRYEMKTGDIILIPPNVPHEFMFPEDTSFVDIFAPGRQDWLDGTATYFQK
jgi:quercetin dioxygenase-like cupin family protein